MKRIAILYCFFVLLTNIRVMAQSDSTKLNRIEDFNPQIHSTSQFLLPLDMLIDSAIIRSPMIKFWEADMSSQDYKMKSAKINWMRSFNIDAETRYGSVNNVYVGATETVISTRDNTTWGVGASMKLPIYEFFNTRNAVKTIEMEKNKAIYKREEQISMLKREVMAHYYEFLFKEQSVKIRNANMQSTAMQLQMAELDFKNGMINVTELVRLTQQHAVNQFEYEKERRDFILELRFLEELVGIKFIK